MAFKNVFGREANQPDDAPRVRGGSQLPGKPGSMSDEDYARTQKRQTDNDYRALIALSEAFLSTTHESQALDLAAFHNLQREVLAMYYSSDLAYLVEPLQMTRLDEKYYIYHAIHVALLNLIIGGMLSLDDATMERLAGVGLVIDIGMLPLPEHILGGTATLTAGERVRVRQHPHATIILLKKAGCTDEALMNGVLYHHERYNGTGYPRKLTGEDIPLEARITAVSDSFDAAISRKRYRGSKSPFQVLDELYQNPDNLMDPNIVRTATEGLAKMAVGGNVVLSDRSIGRVVAIQPGNIGYPVVRVLGREIQTGPELYPLTLSGSTAIITTDIPPEPGPQEPD